MAKTVLQEVKERMQEMQDSKAAQLATIQQKQDEARSQIEAAALAMKQATEEMNVDSYAEAQNRKRKAQTALDMYNGRYDQISKQEYISEEESDRTIDRLLAYEAQLAEDFKAAAKAPMEKLAELVKSYKSEIEDTEKTIRDWHHNIRPNYSTRGIMHRMDKATGKMTDRAEAPVPVHQTPFTGCAEAEQLESYLRKAQALKEG